MISSKRRILELAQQEGCSWDDPELVAILDNLDVSPYTVSEIDKTGEGNILCVEFFDFHTENLVRRLSVRVGDTVQHAQHVMQNIKEPHHYLHTKFNKDMGNQGIHVCASNDRVESIYEVK